MFAFFTDSVWERENTLALKKMYNANSTLLSGFKKSRGLWKDFDGKVTFLVHTGATCSVITHQDFLFVLIQYLLWVHKVFLFLHFSTRL